jgi:hypothetical protein
MRLYTNHYFWERVSRWPHVNLQCDSMLLGETRGNRSDTEYFRQDLSLSGIPNPQNTMQYLYRLDFIHYVSF